MPTPRDMRALIAGGCERRVVAGCHAVKGAAAAARLAAEGPAGSVLACDMAGPAAPGMMGDEAVRRVGKVDVPVTAAGDSARGGIDAADAALRDRLFAGHARGPALAIGRVARHAWHGAGDGRLAAGQAAQVVGQLVEPDELARLIADLAGPRSGVMTGAAIDVDRAIASASPDAGASPDKRRGRFAR